MPTKTLSVSKGNVSATIVGGGSGVGCGNNKRLYVGRDGNREYRSRLQFTQDWTDVGRIVRATLKVYTDDGFGRMPLASSTDTPTLYVRRVTQTWSEGNNSDEDFDTSDFISPNATTSGAKKALMAKAFDEATEIDVTAIWNAIAPKKVKQTNGKAGAGRTDFGIVLFPHSSAIGDAWSGWSEDYTANPALRPVVELEYDLGLTLPETPANLDPVGTVAALDAFEGDFEDDDPADTLAFAEVEVYKADGVTRIYQSMRVPASQGDIADARFHVVPHALALTANTTYRWRARVTDQDGSVSAWTALTSFEVANNPPDAPGGLPGGTPDLDSLAGYLFEGTYSDSLDDPEDPMLAYQIQLSQGIPPGDPGWDVPTNLFWNTGKRLVDPTATGFSTGYGGAGLEANAYGWRARVWDRRNGVSEWSYAEFNLTESFEPQPGDQETVQIDAHAPWRLVFRAPVFTESPDIELVQSKTDVDLVEFDAQCETGNLILVWSTHNSTVKPAMPSDFTNISLVRRGIADDWGRMSYRYAQEGGDMGSYASDGSRITITEWRAVYAKQYRGVNRHQPTVNFRAGGNIKPTKGVPCVLVGGGIWGFTSGDGSNSHLSVAGTTANIQATTGTEPEHWMGYRPINPTGLYYNLGGTIGASVAYGGVTVVLHKRNPDRGPGEIVAVIEDAKAAGASEMYNSPGELHFAIPVDHPQIDVLEPKQVHYEVQFYTGDGWRGVYNGYLWDLDTTDQADAVFTGIDYLAAFDTQMDRRYDSNNINKAAEKGGSKYVNRSLSYIVEKALNRAITAENSLVGFISLGEIDEMASKTTIWSTMVPTLEFVVGLIDSHRQGTGKNSRVQVRKTGETSFEVVVQENPGRERPDMRMRYGELVNGYRVIFFGPFWKTVTAGIGRTRTGSKVYYNSAGAPGLDQSTWGSIQQAQLFDGVSDLPDLKRRVKQAALTSSKLGSQIALKIREGLIQPKEGHDITDHILVEIKDGVTDTSRFGSGFYTIMGIAWEAGGPEGTDSSNDLILSLVPRSDLEEPDDDLVESVEVTGSPAYASGFGPPGEDVTADFYLDLNTGILYQRDPDGNFEDDSDPEEGTETENEPDQGDP